MRLRETYSGERLDQTEGLKILRPDSWAHIRSSNTEPILRVVVEARHEDSARAWAKEIVSLIGNA